MRQEQTKLPENKENQCLESELHRAENWKEPKRKEQMPQGQDQKKSQTVESDFVLKAPLLPVVYLTMDCHKPQLRS